MIRTTQLVLGAVVLVFATRSSLFARLSDTASPSPATVPEGANLSHLEHRAAGVTPDLLAGADDERRAASAAWMERSRALGAAVDIEDLHYARATAADGRTGIAVVGRAVNQSGTALSLLTIHLALTGPSGAIGNVPVIAKPEELAPGASKTFAFMIDPAAGGFSPVRGAASEQPPITREDQRALGRITAYVTYAGE